MSGAVLLAGLGSPSMAEPTAVQILKNPAGDCSEHCLLFTTLCRAAGIPGVYVPLLYDARYEDGRFSGVFPIDERAPALVRRRVEPRLGRAGYPGEPLVAITEATHDRLAVEIARGCTRGCRFCQAGMVTRPVRNRPAAEVVSLVDDGITTTGNDEVSLLSLSASCVRPEGEHLASVSSGRQVRA